MLSNKVVFLAQRCPKFKKKCLHWNNFLRAGRGQGVGGDLVPPLFFQLDTFTPCGPSPGPSSIFFFQTAGKSHYKTDSECHGAEPCFRGFLLMTLHCGRVTVFVSVLHWTVPEDSDEGSQEPIRIALPLCQVGHSCTMQGFLSTQASVGCLRLLWARL